MNNYKVSIITIGDEILIGQIVDTNSAWIGEHLSDIGLQVIEKIAISDDISEIVHGIDRAVDRADIVIITGGLGPTRDDKTIEALSQYFDVNLVFHEETYGRIKDIFAKRDIPLKESHKAQCNLPANATVWSNNKGTAPGTMYHHKETTIISMPGVPYEMKSIMEVHAIPYLSERYGGGHIMHHTILTAGLAESTLSDMISDVEDHLPNQFSIAYLPNINKVRVRISGRGDDRSLLERQLQTIKNQIETILKPYIYGSNKERIEAVVQQMCIQRGLTLGTAESCTGGAIASAITSIPGSSEYYTGSVIAYDNSIKENILDVSSDTLKRYGAVSEEVVKEMVMGVINLLKVDLAIAVSGIAGPDGGTAEKPVGTIWLAIGNAEQTKTFLLKGRNDRALNISYTVTQAINQLRLFIQEYYG